MRIQDTILLVTVALATSACTMQSPTMRSFDDCGQFRSYMKTARVLGSLGNRLAASSLDFSEILVADLDSQGNSLLSNAVDTDPWSGGAEHFTDTNLQHAGVDEADLVKTDGLHLFAISGGQLVVSRAWPVEEAKQLSTVGVDGTAVGLYNYDQTVVVISLLGADEEPNPVSGGDAYSGLASWRAGASVAVTVVDVADPENPGIVRETYTTGVLRESRMIGSALYVITTDDLRQADNPEPATDEEKEYRKTNALDWLPVRFDNLRNPVVTGWNTRSEPACDCATLSAPVGGTETIVTSVMVLDLDNPRSEFDGGGIVSPAGVVYTSPTSLYIANTELVEPTVLSPEGTQAELMTSLHRFSLTSGVPDYDLSHRVEGVLPDRFGLSEHDGILRVATLDTSDMTSGVTTLRVADGEFCELDHLGGLAPGEDLTAARFVETFGYVVTYVEEKGDPLFALDLSDPENITLGGQLDIPGWSDYLHPMDEPGKLLAVGMDQDWAGSWELSVSIFDVTDPTWPTLDERVLLDASGSEASVDHHAFTYDPVNAYLTIPSWSSSGETVLEVLEASAKFGLNPIGRIEQPDFGSDECVGIRRSVMMEDEVWSYSTGGLVAAPLAFPEDFDAVVQFDGVDPCLGLVPPDADAQ